MDLCIVLCLVQEHLTVAAVGWTQGQRLVLEPGDAPLENEVIVLSTRHFIWLTLQLVSYR